MALMLADASKNFPPEISQTLMSSVSTYSAQKSYDQSKLVKHMLIRLDLTSLKTWCTELCMEQTMNRN